MKKRILSLVLALMLCLAVFAGCGQNATEPSTGNEDEKVYRIAVLLSGYRGDGAYNDYIYQGVVNAEKDLPVEIKFLETTEAADWESNLIAMASDGYDLVVGASNQYQDIILKQAPNFPDVKFAMIDGSVDLDNVVSVSFSFADGGFLAGAAAAILANSPNVPGITGSKTVGFVGAMEIPILQEFYNGYEAGVHYIDPEIRVLSAYAGSFGDPLKGKELAYAQFEQGADLIVQSAAGTGNGVMEVALEKGKFVIGLDVFEQGAYLDTMMTNVYRHIDEALYNVIKSVVDGTYEGGTHILHEASAGLVSLYKWDNFKRILGNDFPEELETKINEIEQKFIDGEFVVENGIVIIK